MTSLRRDRNSPFCSAYNLQPSMCSPEALQMRPWPLPNASPILRRQSHLLCGLEKWGQRALGRNTHLPAPGMLWRKRIGTCAVERCWELAVSHVAPKDKGNTWGPEGGGSRKESGLVSWFLCTQSIRDSSRPHVNYESTPPHLNIGPKTSQIQRKMVCGLPPLHLHSI